MHLVVEPDAIPTRSDGARRRAAAVAGTRPGRVLARIGGRIRDNLHDPGTVLAIVLIAAFAARVAWLNLPRGGLIFDEAYYVNAARTLLGWTVPDGAHYAGSLAGLDPNTEHPPLGKLLIALSMLVFGDNGFGWRVPSVVAGLIALAATHRIVRTTGESAWMAVLVIGFLAFDNLTLVHGRIGTLDMLVLAPILVASWLALRGRWALAGVAVAIGILIKITAIYGVGAILLLYLMQNGGRWWRERRITFADLRGPIVFVAAFVVVGFAGLAFLDARYTAFATPFDHVRRMLEYGAKLAAPTANTGICPGADSLPWQWIFNECQIGYLRVDVTVRAGEEVLRAAPSIDFRGALNPLLAGAIPLSALFVFWYAWRTGNGLARWAVAWGAANYLPYVALGILTHRITYIYYLLPAIPAIAAAVAILLLRAGLPRFVLWGFVVAYVIGFAAYFPFRQIP